MRKLMTIAAAGALLAGIAVANAQSTKTPLGSTPGAGAPGQDERGGDMEKTPGAPKVKDAPPSATSGAAPTTPAPKAAGPAMKNDSSIHQSTGDRDSRGTPKEK